MKETAMTKTQKQQFKLEKTKTKEQILSPKMSKTCEMKQEFIKLEKKEIKVKITL